MCVGGSACHAHVPSFVDLTHNSCIDCVVRAGGGATKVDDTSHTIGLSPMINLDPLKWFPRSKYFVIFGPRKFVEVFGPPSLQSICLILIHYITSIIDTRPSNIYASIKNIPSKISQFPSRYSEVIAALSVSNETCERMLEE